MIDDLEDTGFGDILFLKVRTTRGKIDGASVDAGRANEEELHAIATLPKAGVTVTLEAEVRVPDGIPDDVVRTMSEDCGPLRFRSSGFEEK